ncbi:MAG TPA: hypothetical protein VGE94_15030 [Chloroflexota bacterium]
MPHTSGPEQTDTWPLVWDHLDPKNLPGWVVWDRACQVAGQDGKACPRRVAGLHYGIRRCDHHWPTGLRIPTGQMIG